MCVDVYFSIDAFVRVGVCWNVFVGVCDMVRTSRFVHIGA